MKKLTLLIVIPMMLGCGGDDDFEHFYPEEQTMQGVVVTNNVPFIHESNEDIINRMDNNFLGDRVIPNHEIKKEEK